MRVSVIIVNYNGLKNTLECLRSFESVNWQGWKKEIFTVDNNSSDGSQEVLEKQKGITYIKNDQNVGFCKANNIAIKKAIENKSDYVLVINNDTIVSIDFFINLVNRAQKADIISPKIYFEKDFEFHKNRYKKNDLGKVIWYTGGKIDWQNIIGNHIGVDEVDIGQYDRGRYIEFATGACMLIKREVFEKIGFFDEKYFLYLEDMDFCVRASRNGFKIYYEPKSIIWHKNAGSSSSGSKLQDYFITRNRLLFGFKFAKLRTKMALIREAFRNFKNPIKRKAFIDFLLLNFNEGSFKIK